MTCWQSGDWVELHAVWRVSEIKGGLVGRLTGVLCGGWVDMRAVWLVFELAGCLVGELTCLQSGWWVGDSWLVSCEG